MFDSITCKAVYHDAPNGAVTTVAEYKPADIPATDDSYVMFHSSDTGCKVIAELFTANPAIGRYSFTRWRKLAAPLIVDRSFLLRG